MLPRPSCSSPRSAAACGNRYLPACLPRLPRPPARLQREEFLPEVTMDPMRGPRRWGGGDDDDDDGSEDEDDED